MGPPCQERELLAVAVGPSGQECVVTCSCGSIMLGNGAVNCNCGSTRSGEGVVIRNCGSTRSGEGVVTCTCGSVLLALGLQC